MDKFLFVILGKISLNVIKEKKIVLFKFLFLVMILSVSGKCFRKFLRLFVVRVRKLY